MPEYRDVNGKVLPMREALEETIFTLSWSDGPVVTCVRRGIEPEWDVDRTVRGIKAGSGRILETDDGFYWIGHPNRYNTFDEAARRIIEPVG